MKKIRKVFIHLLGSAAPLALALAVLTTNATCHFFSYQPDEPAGIEKYKHNRRNKYD